MSGHQYEIITLPNEEEKKLIAELQAIVRDVEAGINAGQAPAFKTDDIVCMRHPRTGKIRLGFLWETNYKLWHELPWRAKISFEKILRTWLE